MKHYWQTAVILIALCSLPAQAQQVAFTPAAGFSGESQGTGSLRLLLGKPRPYHVVSFGRKQNDGTFRLYQTVTFEGKPAQQRFWLIRETAPLHYTGTLSDAAGPVSGRTVGARLCLRYRIKGWFVMHQTLQLGSDTKTIDNVGRITFLGIPVGSLHETIRRAER